MLWLRRFTFLVLVAAGLLVIYVAIHVFWNVRPYDYLPSSQTQAQVISDRLILYSRQAEDVARLVAILLIVSGLYTIAQAILSQLAAERVLNRLDSTIDSTRHEFALAAGDLRELKEDVTRAVERATAQTAAFEEIRAEVRQRLGLTPYPTAAAGVGAAGATAPAAEAPAPAPETAEAEPAIEETIAEAASTTMEAEPVADEEPAADAAAFVAEQTAPAEPPPAVEREPLSETEEAEPAAEPAMAESVASEKEIAAEAPMSEEASEEAAEAEAEPAAVEATAAVEEPLVAEEPAPVSEEPAPVSEEPVIAEERAVAAEPAEAEEPVVAGEAAVLEETVAADELGPAEESLPDNETPEEPVLQAEEPASEPMIEETILAGEPEPEPIPDWEPAEAAEEQPAAAAEMQDPYTVACELAQQGAVDPLNRDALYTEAVAQLRTAVAIGSGDVERQLLADMEEGGPLFALANTPPYDAEVLDLLMNVSVA